MNSQRANNLKTFEDAQQAVMEFDTMMQRVQKTGERIFAEAETIGALLAAHRLLLRVEARRTAAPILLATQGAHLTVLSRTDGGEENDVRE